MVVSNFAAAWDAIARDIPEREALVCGDRRLTWAQFSERSHRLASHLQHLGLVAGDKVAIDLPNRTEYLEAFYGALVLGCVPVNVDDRSTADQVHFVVDGSGAKVVVHTAEVAKNVAKAARRIPKPWRPALLEVGEPYERALASATLGAESARAPTGDDLVLLYAVDGTGTTRGAMWRNEDLYLGLQGRGYEGSWMLVAPLAHGTGLFPALAILSSGGAIVLVDHRDLDAEQMWDTVEREQVRTITVVGDAFARQLLDALALNPGRWNITCLRGITSSGTPFSANVKHALVRELPWLATVDAPGDAGDQRGTAVAPEVARVNERLVVLDERTWQPVTPGSDEVGVVAKGGNIPIGYYDDPAATAATFRVFDGRRYRVTANRATVAADGMVQILGHTSVHVGPGGEEANLGAVERALLKHPSVFECAVLVVSFPGLGERGVAIVQVAENHYLDAAELHAWSKRNLTAAAMPREWLFVDTLPRSAAGSVDHRELRSLAMERLGLA